MRRARTDPRQAKIRALYPRGICPLHIASIKPGSPRFRDVRTLGMPALRVRSSLVRFSPDGAGKCGWAVGEAPAPNGEQGEPEKNLYSTPQPGNGPPYGLTQGVL